MRFTDTRGGGEVGWREAIDGIGPTGGGEGKDRPPSDAPLRIPSHLPRTFDDTRTDLPFGAWSLPRAAAWFDESVDTLGLGEALDLPIRIRTLGSGIDLLDLTGGPTGAFKDLGARVLARLWSAWPRDDRRERCVLVATSGDTGGAVAAAVEGLPHLRAVIVFPLGRVSEVQRRHFTTRAPGVRAVGVHGSFDDCQRIVREALRGDAIPGAGTGPALVSANSINPGRLLPQALYHGWAAARTPGRPVVIPSGNLGNLTAALLARGMGAPLGPIVAAVNENDTLVRVAGGETPRRGPSIVTDSTAMDVAVPSNLERLEWWARATGSPLDELVAPASIGVGEARRAQRWAHEEHGVIIDPHTAVGVARALRLRESEPGVRPLVVETAHPAKFPDQIRTVLGCDPPSAPHLVREGSERIDEIEARVEALTAVVTDGGTVSSHDPPPGRGREER
ncbi:MAG: threonine synthase [Longimicrobiales bacterium]|nr:threonine synthase [Longimicrobiales bacterium]